MHPSALPSRSHRESKMELEAAANSANPSSSSAAAAAAAAAALPALSLCEGVAIAAPTHPHIPPADMEMGLKSDIEALSPAAQSPTNMSNSFAFRHISYSIKLADKQVKQILQNVSGYVRCGEMLALMGPSGSGKTSLLNVLAMKVDQSNVSGEIFVNGISLSKNLKRTMGFVFQDDLMFAHLTVQETIMFSARLKLPETTPMEQHRTTVAELLETLGLTEVADCRLGSFAKRGVSGGERKRVAIGVELVTSPSLLFLDEPTSGLDAATALSVVALLRQLCTQQAKTVVCSIHQPRSDIFTQFHNLLLLQQGKTAFFGTTSTSHEYFTELGLTMPPLTNVADWLLDIVVADTENLKNLVTETPKTAPETLAEKYFQSALLSYTLAKIEQAFTKVAEPAQDRDANVKMWRSSSLYQFRVLLERSYRQQRGEVFSSVTVFQTLVVAGLVCAIWWESTNVSDVSGVFFFISIQQSFSILNGTVRIFPAERNIMLRERSSGAYRVLPYFMAKSLSDMMSTTIFPILYAIVIYWCVGLNATATRHLIFLAIFFSVIVTAQSLGLMLSTIMHDATLCSSVAFVVTLVMTLFGGFYCQPDRIPEGIRWVSNLSFMYWAWGALLRNEYSGQNLDCSAAKGSDLVTDCPFDGQLVLKDFGVNQITLSTALVALWSMTLFYRTLAYIFLRLDRMRV